MRRTSILFPALRTAAHKQVRSRDEALKMELAALAMDEYPPMTFWLAACGHESAYKGVFCTGPFQIDWKAEVDGKKYAVRMKDSIEWVRRVSEWAARKGVS